MTDVASSPTAGEGAGSRLTGSTELARNALGLPQLLFCILTGSAPLAAMMFNDPVSGLGIGISVPSAFWVSAIAFTLFSVGYVEMARRKTTAGGLLLVHDLRLWSDHRPRHGRRDRLGVHALRRRSQRSDDYFANTSIQNLTGFSMDWRIYAFIFIFLLLLITYFHVETSPGSSASVCSASCLILFIFSFSVLFKGGGP